MKDLIDYLVSLHPGPILDTTRLEDLLASCWHEFDGGDLEGMSGDKLRGRMEEVVWKPPVLSFLIERHGGTVLGSTRADIHSWEVNVQECSASLQTGRYRQLRPRQERVDVKPMAEAIIDSIVNQREDNRLKWNKDNSVRVLISSVLPTGSAVSQTLRGRRRRLQKMLDEGLGTVGWHKVRTNVYQKYS